MSLSHIITQASRHFSDSINPSVHRGSATLRQKAAELAWALTSTMRPLVSNSALVVSKLPNNDVMRVATEILGVGVALEVLRSEGIIDGRTIQKLGGRFDYSAIAPGGGGKILIEVKGTTNHSSLQHHRQSIKSKIEDYVSNGGRKGFSRAVGIIFSAWTSGVPRKHDIEVMDPEGDDHDHMHEAVREVIRFYARRFDEDVEISSGAERLWALAASDDLFGRSSLVEIIGRANGDRDKNYFNRASIRLNSNGNDAGEYWGTFFDGDARPCPFELEGGKFRYAYTGMNRKIVDLLRTREFKTLLSFSESEVMLHSSNPRAVVLKDEYGILWGWFDEIPKSIEYEI